jgi:hypothetical protein
MDHLQGYIAANQFLPRPPHGAHSSVSEFLAQGEPAPNEAARFKWGGRGRQGKPGAQQREDSRRFSRSRELGHPSRELVRREVAKLPAKFLHPKPLLLAR